MIINDTRESGSPADAGATPKLATTPGEPVGRVASPMGQESTSSRFHFWVPRGILAEKTHLVSASSVVGDTTLTFYGVVDEVYRRSRKRSIDEEVDTYDGDIDYEPPFGLEGVTFAEVTILRTDPPFLTPPLEQSVVVLAGPEDAAKAYGYDTMTEGAMDWGLPIGLLRNGGAGVAGVARIDLRDLKGDRAGHMNVTGQAGHGTKSSFLLFTVRSLIDFAERCDDGNTVREPFSVRPIIFNVKGNDLMYIDAANKGLTAERCHLWDEINMAPRPFSKAEFRAPCRTGAHGANRGEARVHRPVPPDRQTKPYYWTLADVIRFGLWSYLFSDTAQRSETMMSLAEHILGVIARNCAPDHAHPAGLELRREPGIPQSFAELRTWLRDALGDNTHAARDHGIHTFATVRALLSRLNLALGREGLPIFAEGTGYGRPLEVTRQTTADPLVIDIAALPAELRRFVVAAVLDQVKEHQMGDERVPGRVYFLVLDELGLYAPRGAHDPITKLFENVAAQLRSQGIILLGAQQHASKVSETIFGNSEVKAIGASSPVELESPTWSHLLTPAQKARAMMLHAEEKMVLGGRGWMNVLVPFPAWAMKESEADITSITSTQAWVANGKSGPRDDGANGFRLNLPS